MTRMQVGMTCESGRDSSLGSDTRPLVQAAGQDAQHVRHLGKGAAGTLRSSASRDAEAPLHDAIIQNQKPVFNGVQVKPSGVFDQVCQQVIVALQGALDSVHWDSAMQLLPDLPE